MFITGYTFFEGESYIEDVRPNEIMEKYMKGIPQQVGLNLPKLKKVNPSESKLKLPKLKRV